MNVSESGVYLARELIATGREDLCDRIMAGRLAARRAEARPAEVRRDP